MATVNFEKIVGAAGALKEEELDNLLRRARARLSGELKYERRPEAAAGVVSSVLGDLLVAITGRGIALVHYLADVGDVASTIERLRPRWDLTEDRRAIEAVAGEVRRYLGGEAKALRRDIDLSLVDSVFQQKVLRKLQEVPRGAVISYQALGAAAGVPKGARAVGNAMHRNPVPIYVPCHRVIASGGGLGGYGGGAHRKLQLLRSEGFDLGDTAVRLPGSAVWGHKGTKIYCRADCHTAARVDQNQMLFFADVKNARRAGLRACKVCRPDRDRL
jgi:methylated-DNA-[protein]-cysteine S-methyltransferase